MPLCCLAVMLLTVCFFSAGLCLLVATNVMPVHSQNSKCEGSRISVAKQHSKVALQGKHVQLVIIAPRVLHFSAFISVLLHFRIFSGTVE